MTKAADLSALGSNVTTSGNLSSASTLSLQTNSTTAVTVDTSQNVGIGTTNPSPKITVARTATTSVTNASYYLGLGGTENLLDSKRLIGMGYSLGSSEEYPTAMGYVETSNAGYTNGVIAFYTRSVTTNTAPSERLRIGTSGELGLSGANYGTSGQVLTSNGSGAAPSWASVSGGVTSLNGQTGAITNTGHGDIGSYYVGFGADSTGYSVGSTIAGSSLRYANANSYGGFSYLANVNNSSTTLSNQTALAKSSSGLSGTWRCMTHGGPANSTASMVQLHLWVRIS